ncbi:nucleotidyltransferase family protein [Proteiniclasticum sp. C24MP]|uniref:nucleotidyltransferase family protein n=1 Tax=Proteiniclasticum sp. C24MP TaxID=3374101 RepID=UPI003754ABAE
MKCIILAAGYATRLYPLTENMPKPLLEVAGRSILDRICEKIEKVEEINEIIIVSNHKFIDSFRAWAQRYKGKKVAVLDDGTTSNENRLGAVRDILVAVDDLEINEDIMVLAGDNLFDFELDDFVSFYKEKKTDCITTHIINDMERIRRTGVAELDENMRLLSFEEKPEQPKSNHAVPPFYIYQKKTLPLISAFIEEGNHGDAPGMLISWLLKKVPVHAFHFQGNRYDIGTLESYKEVQRVFSEK